MLKYIRSQVAADVGLDPDNARDKAFLDDKINQVWKKLYESRDLNHCEREQLFSLDTSILQVSLPWYVGQVRGARDFNTKRKIEVQDMKPRYKSDGWAVGPLPWWFRDKGVSPLSRELINESPLTLTIPDVEDEDFSIYISGGNSNAARVTEQVTFAAGDTSKTTTNAFGTVDAFGNVAEHEYDVTLDDADGNELAVLPNVSDHSEYRIFQVLEHDAVITDGDPWMVEVLYKLRWMPLRNDYDEPLCPGYDDAIAFATTGIIKSKSDTSKAAMALDLADTVLQEKALDESKGKSMSIDFAPNKTLYRSRFGGSYGRLFPGVGRR